MSFVDCPCGIRFTGTAEDAVDAYRAHACDYHEPSSWPGIVGLAVIAVVVIVVCLVCTGVIR